MLCRMGGVCTWVLLLYAIVGNIVGSAVSSYASRDYMYMYTLLINLQCAIIYIYI